MPSTLSKPEEEEEKTKEMLNMKDFSKVDFALAFCNIFQFAAMLADKSGGANYQNYLYMAGGDTKKVVSMTANLTSASQIICFIGGPLMGNLSDYVGRKPVLVGQQLIMACCWYLSDASSYASAAVAYPYVVGARHIKALCYGSFMATRMAGLSDLYTGSRLALSHSYLQASMGIGYIVGPLLLSPWVGRSVQRAFLFRIICCIGSASILALLLDETNEDVLNSNKQQQQKSNELTYETSKDKQVNNNSNKKKKKKKKLTLSNPLSFLSLFTRSRSLAYFSIAQAL